MGCGLSALRHIHRGRKVLLSFSGAVAAILRDSLGTVGASLWFGGTVQNDSFNAVEAISG